MSRRISFRSEIKDSELACDALKSLNYAYSHKGDSISITSGPLRNATINLKTGEVVSDTDFHSHEQLGSLRQAYSEAEVRQTISRQGASIESRSVLANGTIEILCRMTG